ncbi:putative ABC transport system permease protein [Arcanobacterium wilhelmae]|uniref:ABC transport system permease protein n=1 Tax=Arcanobacterium wilhelmae TaxID=1803177 RepID=A0ABT9ND56_9ACTO|nr:ABC transporter permease [Arcanobacterium wilhelmae]MDP9801628.1 putative ABC transport system permease protein [Arcanobacterium wilhelmae]WFN90950.1 ABC transporter permease [Arcanobacterium wilhelmae]
MFRMVLQDIRTSRLRTSITAFSIFIGVIAVVFSVLIGTMGKSYLESTIAQKSGRSVTYKADLTDASLTTTALARLDQRVTAMKGIDGTIVIEMPDTLMSLVPGKSQNSDEAATVNGHDTHSAHVVFTDPEYSTVYSVPMDRGQWFQRTDAPTAASIIVNKKLAQDLKGAQTVSAYIGNLRTPMMMRIQGVVNDGEMDEAKVYLRHDQAQTFFRGLAEQGSVSLRLHPRSEGMSQEEVRSRAADIVFDIFGDQKFEFVTTNDGNQFVGVIEFLQLAFLLVSAVILFVSMLGLLNISIASTEQKTRELLIRRAVGASRGSIFVLVLSSIVLLTVAVSILAVGISVVIVQFLPLLVPHDSPIDIPGYPYTAAIAGIGSAVVTGLLAGLIPAYQAARLEPALVLR